MPGSIIKPWWMLPRKPVGYPVCKRCGWVDRRWLRRNRHRAGSLLMAGCCCNPESPCLEGQAIITVNIPLTCDPGCISAVPFDKSRHSWRDLDGVEFTLSPNINCDPGFEKYGGQFSTTSGAPIVEQDIWEFGGCTGANIPDTSFDNTFEILVQFQSAAGCNQSGDLNGVTIRNISGTTSAFVWSGAESSLPVTLDNSLTTCPSDGSQSHYGGTVTVTCVQCDTRDPVEEGDCP